MLCRCPSVVCEVDLEAAAVQSASLIPTLEILITERGSLLGLSFYHTRLLICEIDFETAVVQSPALVSFLESLVAQWNGLFELSLD